MILIYAKYEASRFMDSTAIKMAMVTMLLLTMVGDAGGDDDDGDIVVCGVCVDP